MKTKLDKCIHYDTCKNLSVTMCGKKWSEDGCFIEVPMTNADYIRSMSDEELAEMFHGGGLCNHIQDEHNAHCEARGTCDNCVIEWLKQPKENTDE